MNSDRTTLNNVAPVILLDNKGNSIEISRETIAGREEGCDLLLDEGRCSRKHAKLTPTEDGLLIEDLSSNGTFLNGSRIDKTAVAKPGDEIAFDTDVRFRVQGDKPKVADVTMLAPVPVIVREANPVKTEPSAPEPSAAKAPTVETPTTTDTPDDDEGSKKAWWATQDAGPDGTMLMKPVKVENQAAIEGTTVMNALRTAEPSLVGLSPSVKGQVFKFNGERWKIGRDKECEIVIDDPGISALHAQIINEGETWKLINLMSSNGSFVNGQRVQSAYLNSGDRLQFGSAEFLFNLSGIKAKSANVNTDSVETVSVKSKGLPMWAIGVIGFVVVAAIGAAVLMQS